MSAAQEDVMEGTSKPKASKEGDFSAACAESVVNLALLDPPRWGWTALGGISDILLPHEVSLPERVARMLYIASSETYSLPVSPLQRARRKASKQSFLRQRRKRNRPECTPKPKPAHSDMATPSSSITVERSASDISRKEASGQGFTVNSCSHKTDSLSSEVPKTSLLNGVSSQTVGGQGKEKSGESVSFSALPSDDLLDTLTYHRGRQGEELRDDLTGELLCDTEATDTNHNQEGPRLTAAVTVQFPLEDEEDPSTRRCYREDLVWDLGKLETPTPMQFAMETAESFGLSFAQTIDLAESIQEQLRVFVNENCGYAPPLAIQCDTPQSRPQCFVPTLYGDVTGETEGGQWKVAKQRPRSLSRSSSRSMRPPATDKLASKGKIPAKRRRDSQPVFDAPAEKIYRDEVLKRLRTASSSDIETKWKNGGGSSPLGVIASKENLTCHVCRKKGFCGVFACGGDGHAYCYDHLDKLFATFENPSLPSPIVLRFCPVCSLSCSCGPCASKLDVASADFKRKNRKQGVPPESTVFENFFNHCKQLVPKSDQKKRGRWGYRKAMIARPVVPKVPVTDFPREVFNGVDIDPGTDSIYATVFTKDGSYIEQSSPTLYASAAPESSESNGKDGIVVEDGSVDYCNVCKKVGNLLCCDFCPRAFHRACVPSDDPAVESNDDKWECPSCRNEKDGLPEDELDGSKYSDRVLAAYDDPDSPVTDDDMQALKAICRIYEMVLVLIEYDFGVMFKDPVDTSLIPAYATIVKEPMDLGTIATNIVNGKYRDRRCTGDKPLRDVILAILKDIELVWNNCFTFNREGSAVYRMAEVQRRRASAIRQKSFDSLLCEEVKQKLEDYIASSNQRRQATTRVQQTPLLPEAQLRSRPQPRHKIVATSPGTAGRPIAVFDPDLGRLAKIYTTIQTIVGVAGLFISLKYPCEWGRQEINSSSKMRALIVRSSKDSRIRLFGYRWVFLDDLEKRKVSFSAPLKESRVLEDAQTSDVDSLKKAGLIEEKTNSEQLIEMCIGEHCYVFQSVKTALAYGDFGDCDRTLLEGELNEMHPSEVYTEIADKRWRKLRFATDGENQEERTPERALNQPDLSSFPGIVAVKRDTLTNHIVAGFRTIDAAYVDWLRSIDVSGGPSSMEVFRSSYLEGERSVSGVCWSRTPTQTSGRQQNSTKEDDRGESERESIQVNGSMERTAEPTDKRKDGVAT